MDLKHFNELEIDAIGEILNISLGASATAVSTMLSARVDITTPVVRILSREEFEISNLEPAVGVEITYVEGLQGSNIMLLKRHDVKVIVDMLMGMETPEEEFELNELSISAICEVMNQMMGASATALSEFLSKTVNISTPSSFEVSSGENFKEKYYQDDDSRVVVGFTLKIGEVLESEFLNVMTPNLAKELIAELVQAEPVNIDPPAVVPAPVPVPEEPQPSMQQMAEQMDQMMKQMQMQQQMIQQFQNGEMESRPKISEPKTIQVQSIPGQQLHGDGMSYEEQEENRKLIMGVPLEVSVEIGRTRKLVKDILEFAKGSLVILDKMAGEQVDLFVNGRCIAKGDVVVVDDNFGIRITEIIQKSID